jgi:NADH dehydrogenase
MVRTMSRVRSVLVAGAGGRLGGPILEQLTARGLQVTATYRTERDGLPGRIAASGARPVQVDLRDADRMRRLLAGVDAAIFATALDASASAARVLQDGQPAVFVSSNNVGRDTQSPHYRKMARAEAAIHDTAPWAVILRPTLIYGGKDDKNLLRMMRIIQRFPVVLRPWSDALQQPVFYRDLAQVAVQMACDPGRAGRTVSVAGPDIVTQGDLIAHLIRALGVRRIVVPVPIPTALAAARLAQRLGLARPALLRQLHRALQDKRAQGPDIITTRTHLKTGLKDLAETLLSRQRSL